MDVSNKRSGVDRRAVSERRASEGQQQGNIDEERRSGADRRSVTDRRQHDLEHSMSIGLEAMELSKAKSVPPIPQNYELLFNYVSGENQPLVKALGQFVDGDETLSDTAARRIHDEHLSPTRQADACEEISSQLSGELGQIMSLIHGATESSHEFGDALDGVTARMDDAESGADLKLIVQGLAQASRQMESNGRDLEAKLKESQEHIDTLNEQLNEVRTESRTDGLTGIANRKSFDETLEAEIAAANEIGTDLCLCIGDVDRFKSFNDTHGHQVGDRVLRLVAGILSNHLKGRDVAARYGGEEFAMILPQTDLRGAVSIADQIRERIEAKELINKSTSESLGTVTISFGASRYRPGESAAELIQRADDCLYAAKNGGRNQVKCEADPGVETNAA